MEFKEQYSEAEIDELIGWFSSHRYENEIDLGSGLVFSDIKKALPLLINVARSQRTNRNFTGQIYLLFRLRDALVEQGKVIE